ncbi:MAG: hypothetical protein LWX00_03135 [Spirochaetia bacterium]|nr:hypothetical protein [Spirochaetia bacterium]
MVDSLQKMNKKVSRRRMMVLKSAAAADHCEMTNFRKSSQFQNFTIFKIGFAVSRGSGEPRETRAMSSWSFQNASAF